MQSETPKIFLGLSPKATLINGLILLAVASLYWAIVLVQQIPDNIELNSETANQLKIEIPWYIDMPVTIFGAWMIMRWVYFKFNLQSGWSFQNFKYDLAIFSFIAIYGPATKIIFLLLLLIFR